MKTQVLPKDLGETDVQLELKHPLIIGLVGTGDRAACPREFTTLTSIQLANVLIRYI